MYGTTRWGRETQTAILRTTTTRSATPSGLNPDGATTEASSIVEAPAQNQPPSPAQEVLTQVEKEFPDLSVTNVKDLKAHNGHENIKVDATTTADGLKSFEKTYESNKSIFPPKDSARIDINIDGKTYTLHVESPSKGGSGDVSTLSFQAHIDRGNPNHFGGAFVHTFVDGMVGAVFHTKDPGLDPQ